LERSQFKLCPECSAALPAEQSRCACGHDFGQDSAPSSTTSGRSSPPGRSVHTHYDNLKVTRDAPAEVIRAAYRALCRKHHPDRRSDDPQSVSVMQVLNAAYEVLSDPERRKQHDNWIEQAHAGLAAVGQLARLDSPGRADLDQPDGTARARQRAVWVVGLVAFATGVLAASAAVLYFGDELPVRVAAPAARGGTAAAPAAGPPAPSASTYLRRPLAPNGMRWPEASGYVEGYAKLRTDGALALLLDNSRNGADVFAKLVALDAGEPIGVRAVFVKAGERFTLDHMRPGTYAIRYRDLDTGIVTSSSHFILQEFADPASSPIESLAIVLPLPPGPDRERVEAPDVDF